MRLSAEVLHQNLEVDLIEAGWDFSSGYAGESQASAAMSSIYRSLVKKFHNEQRSKDRDAAALALFLECNSRCAQFERIEPTRLDEEVIIGELKRSIYNFFHPSNRASPFLLNRTDISSNFRWGNGANIGTRSTDFYSKSTTSTMASTNDFLPIFFKADVSLTSPLWADVEAYRSKRFGYEYVKGSKLSFVPKTRSISRTICTEPLLNMLYQQGIANVLQGRLREVFGIDFSNQPERNARLARIGSQSGEFGTIDLSSASDTISLTLVKELVPKESYFWLDKTRSPTTTLPGGEVIDLHMISSMGNGYTFPLQTMIFACLVSAVYRVYDIPFIKPTEHTDGNFAVFGDDIIVHRDVYDVMVRCLSLLGFTVNRDKSFNEGLFRESCGSDWFSGHNVRGVYISRLLTDGDVYSAINRLNRWSAYHGIRLPNTVGYLRRGCRFIGVPYDEADDAGIKIPLTLARHARGDSHGTYRYMALCNLPVRAKLPMDGCGDNDSTVIAIRKLLPDFEYAPAGLLLSLLAGDRKSVV